MIEEFKKAVTDLVTFTDEQIENLFWFLVGILPNEANDAFRFIRMHRNELAEEIAKTFLKVVY